MLGCGLAGPVGLAVVLFVGTTAYFTYAPDAAGPGILGRAAGPAIFTVVGAAGVTGVAAGALADRAGGRTVAVTALLLLGVALALLGLRAASPSALLVSAVFLGAANTIGSAALAIWTAAVIPDDPASGFHRGPDRGLGQRHPDTRGGRSRRRVERRSSRSPARRGRARDGHCSRASLQPASRPPGVETYPSLTSLEGFGCSHGDLADEDVQGVDSSFAPRPFP